ncbi:MAG: DNA methyltransferase, partial [Flavobacteriales bacterium]|nr:DNA methyltransferase [Flavobacteriales bacterium]
YETFLSEYDPKLRKARGVWYTPAPVVNFIVRAVDDILKTEFDLPQGLADTSKTKITVNTQTPDKRSATGYKQMEKEVHKVQVLDPATGTGTFLAEVIKHVHKKFKGQEGIWSGYVEKHLLPRLNGFELLMASYAMAHLQLDLLLKETGFKATTNQRTRVYLTNSLEEYHPDTGTLFANWLSSEANEANHIKRDTPVMCVIGNPPYAVSSTNKNPWIENLIADYKKNLNEKSYNSLSDDYVKFIRYGQHFVDKNGSGILAYISNNSFIDGIVFRQMRNNLLESFDKIYILDLHGNSKKKEVSPDGSADQNVFDIMQGVSINIFVKTGKKKKNKLGELSHFDLFGKREAKYEYLKGNSIQSIEWNILKNETPNFFFVKKDFKGAKEYETGFKIDALFPINSVGIVTSKDAILISHSKSDLTNKVEEHYEIEVNSQLIQKIDYRTFDKRFIYYDTKIVDRARDKVMRHLLKPNLTLIAPKQAIRGFRHIFIGNSPCDKNYIDSAGQFGAGNSFPLYIYPDNNEQKTIEDAAERKPNLNQEIVNEIAKSLSLTFTNEKEATTNTFAPIDILDFIYAVLHSPTYRDKYQEFLKIDFPRIPYPKDTGTFWTLVKLGGKIRQIHLLESPKVEDYITTYPKDGSNTITTKVAKKDWELFDRKKQLGRIWINEEQYFDNIPLTAWEFHIGGYQPAQKWLKDRKERTLEFDDILHYQKIIVALSETDKLMKEIDEIEIE